MADALALLGMDFGQETSTSTNTSAESSEPTEAEPSKAKKEKKKKEKKVKEKKVKEKKSRGLFGKKDKQATEDASANDVSDIDAFAISEIDTLMDIA